MTRANNCQCSDYQLYQVGCDCGAEQRERDQATHGPTKLRSQQDIQAEYDCIKAELEASQKTTKEIAMEELKQIKLEYVYTVTWKNKHIFKCERVMSEQSKSERLAWKAKYPDVHLPFASDDDKIDSMNYMLVTNIMMYIGGGTLTLITTRKKRSSWSSFTDEPLELTDKEVQSLRAGIVPDSLKQWALLKFFNSTTLRNFNPEAEKNYE